MSPVDDEVAAHWQEVFETALQQDPSAPGLWVMIADSGLGYWHASLGNAVAGGAAATVDDHSQIGSVTKTFTATAVLQRVADGELALDDTVADVIPDTAAAFPPTAALTVEQLLNMTSGLPDHATAATAQAAQNPTKVWTSEELIQVALDAAPVKPPGTPGYSTTNYIILGLMLEQLTGKPVDEVLTGVATQAGLAKTALLPGDQNALPEPSSHGYLGETDVTDWSASWFGAGGAMYSTIDDLFRWSATAMGTTLLPKDLGDERLTLDSTIEEGQRAYGLGIMELLPGWVGHFGQTYGWSTVGMYDPETGSVFAAISNGANGVEAAVRAWASEQGSARVE